MALSQGDGGRGLLAHRFRGSNHIDIVNLVLSFPSAGPTTALETGANAAPEAEVSCNTDPRSV
jgi:hypothetical protein